MYKAVKYSNIILANFDYIDLLKYGTEIHECSATACLNFLVLSHV